MRLRRRAFRALTAEVFCVARHKTQPHHSAVELCCSSSSSRLQPVQLLVCVTNRAASKCARWHQQHWQFHFLLLQAVCQFINLHATQIKCWLSPCTTPDSISTLQPAYVPKVHHSQHKTQPLGSIVRKCDTILRVAFSSQVFHTFTVFLVSPSNETS